MNKFLKTGLLLQIPNAIFILALGIIFILPYITLDLIVLVIPISLYVLMNIASIIYIVVGVIDNGK